MTAPSDDNVTPVARRGSRLAAAAGLAALVPEALHGAEDVRAGIGSTPALLVLLLVQVVAIAWALRGRRWAVRLLLVISAGWIAAALADHGEVFIDPAGFRSGWASTAALLALLALNLATATYGIAPAMPVRWDALKAAPHEAWDMVEFDQAVLLDVRTARERASGVIPGAVAASWLRPAAPEGDHNVLVVCSHGARALYAVRALRAQGLAARSIRGGMNAYSREDLPLERSA